MTFCYFGFPGLVVFSPDPDPKLCSSAGLVKFQNVCLSRCHGIFYRRNTIKQCEEFNCTERSEAYQKEIGHRCCNFLFNFRFPCRAILKTLDKVNSLSSIKALSFGENEEGKFCVLQIFGAPCVKTLIDHKLWSITKSRRVDNILSRVSTALLTLKCEVLFQTT